MQLKTVRNNKLRSKISVQDYGDVLKEGLKVYSLELPQDKRLETDKLVTLEIALRRCRRVGVFNR